MTLESQVVEDMLAMVPVLQSNELVVVNTSEDVFENGIGPRGLSSALVVMNNSLDVGPGEATQKVK